MLGLKVSHVCDSVTRTGRVTNSVLDRQNQFIFSSLASLPLEKVSGKVRELFDTLDSDKSGISFSLSLSLSRSLARSLSLSLSLSLSHLLGSKGIVRRTKAAHLSICPSESVCLNPSPSVST